MLIFLALPAFGDVVRPIPCPDGAEQRGGHTRYCAPTTCASDTECTDEGKRCVSTPLCTETKTMRKGGRRPPGMEPGTFTAKVAHGPCVKGACDKGTCETANRCASGAGTQGGIMGKAKRKGKRGKRKGKGKKNRTVEPTVPEPEEAGGCGCSTTLPMGTGAVLVGLLGLTRRRNG